MSVDQPLLLAFDLGTTHCKAALFRPDGEMLAAAMAPMQAVEQPGGGLGYDPQALCHTALALAERALVQVGGGTVRAVGIASMAESGLLVDRHSGAVRSCLVPWFDTGAQSEVPALTALGGEQERFVLNGIYPLYKVSLAKILELRRRDPHTIDGALWLPAASFLAYCLTGAFGCDYSLAGRTYAYRRDTRGWNTSWLARLGLPEDLFPPLLANLQPVGVVSDGLVGITSGAPVFIAGHDHVTGALAAGAITPGVIYDSMGTAETLMGVRADLPLGLAEFDSGLSYGSHVVEGLGYWLGGLPASGGSVEWLRGLLGGGARLDYEGIEQLAREAGDSPTGILYFPYLLGSGSPHSSTTARAAFIGLDGQHGRAHLLKAVLEGTAFEMEYIRRAATANSGGEAGGRILAAGGGTRNPAWMQIKADVTGCDYEVLPAKEATLQGAALIAAVGSGVFPDVDRALQAFRRESVEVYQPHPERHAQYCQLFDHYTRLLEPVHAADLSKHQSEEQ